MSHFAAAPYLRKQRKVVADPERAWFSSCLGTIAVLKTFQKREESHDF